MYNFHHAHDDAHVLHDRDDARAPHGRDRDDAHAPRDRDRDHDGDAHARVLPHHVHDVPQQELSSQGCPVLP